ncbi:MAG TPA: LOG family protein, partial [Candidatus Obscuribacterales bacterium]
MEASNRGAYQAGGRSIGVSLELPWEQSSNGYQTTVLTHANYFTRKEILRAHDAAVIEMGGYGTLDEFAEVLTHIQTQKKVGTPIYLIESKATKRFDKYVRELESEGTISKGDRDLYIMVKGPDDVIHDLARRRLQTREPSVDQTVPAFDAAGITFRQSNPSIGIFKPKS